MLAPPRDANGQHQHLNLPDADWHHSHGASQSWGIITVMGGPHCSCISGTSMYDNLLIYLD